MIAEVCDACGSDEVYTTVELGTSCSGCGHILRPPASKA